ncbi:hypothetical protein HOY80DRAFT_1135667 [Tuber brumale]|nr:hypothetical protein HOY80DRAFT_1135667 [Tuber brumale]
MATNIFKLLTRPPPLPCVQAIRCSRRLPSYSRWISMDSGSGEDNQGSEDKPGSEGKHSRGDKYSNADGFSHLEFKESEIGMHKTITQMVTSMTTGFAKTDTNHARQDARLTFIQWQLGIIISGMIASFSISYYQWGFYFHHS